MARQKLQEQRLPRSKDFVVRVMDDLVQLGDKDIQDLMRQTDQRDLVLALKGVRQEVRGKVLGNLSQRVRSFIEEEMEFLDEVEEQEVQQARDRMLATLHAPKRKPKKLSKKYLDQKRKTKSAMCRPLVQFSFDELNQLFLSLSEIARREDILALEEIAIEAQDEFLEFALRLAVDGSEPGLIADLLEQWKVSLISQQEKKYQKVIQGITAIQSGDNPRIVEHKLALIF